MMECHDCRRSLYWEDEPGWQGKEDSAYFAPGIVDQFVRCLRCFKLEMDGRHIPYTDDKEASSENSNSCEPTPH